MTHDPHDALFKTVFENPSNVAAELRAILPRAILERIDLATLTLCPGNFVDKDLRRRYSDLLFTVQTTAAEHSFLYLLFEHLSTSSALLPFDLLHCETLVWSRWLREHPKARKLPMIMSVVVSHAKKVRPATADFADIIDLEPNTLELVRKYLPRFDMVIDNLSHEEDSALRRRLMPAALTLALLCLKHSRSMTEAAVRLAGWGDLLERIVHADHGTDMFEEIMRYISLTSRRLDRQAVEQVLVTHLGEEARNTMKTWGQKLIDQGREEGLAGQREMLLTQLRLRFGDLPEAVLERVGSARTKRLIAWAKRVLTAKTLDDVFGR
jgi:predicted transposase YdaD